MEKMQFYLAIFLGVDIAYYISFLFYCVFTTSIFLFIGYKLNYFLFIIILLIVYNLVRKYTYGLHFTNGKCFIFTLCMILIFGYFYKVIPFYLVLGCGLFSIRNIYIESPLKLTVKNKDLKWHENRIELILGECLIISSMCLHLYPCITKAIMLSLCMVDLTLIINKNEKEQL